MELAAKLMESGTFGQEEVDEAEPVLAEVPEVSESATETPKPAPNDLDLEEAASVASASQRSVFVDADGEIVVDSEHAEVLEAVAKATAEAAKQAVSLPASAYINVLQAELEKLRKERLQLEPDSAGRRDGFYKQLVTAGLK